MEFQLILLDEANQSIILKSNSLNSVMGELDETSTLLKDKYSEAAALNDHIRSSRMRCLGSRKILTPQVKVLMLHKKEITETTCSTKGENRGTAQRRGFKFRNRSPD